MLSRVGGLVAIAGVLALPFLLRPKDHLLDPAGEPLVILTPHNEAIRYEFARGFRNHIRETTGRRVRIDWRTPGGTNEITRFIASEYTTAFESYWKGRLGRKWTAQVAFAFANPAIQASEGGAGNLDGAVLARKTFLDSDVGIGIDLLFGGGNPAAVRLAASGWLVDARPATPGGELAGGREIPDVVGGSRFRDQEGRWIGTCLSAFGICFNRDVLSRLGVDSVPEAWRDLADPVYFGQLALADPTKSGSAAAAFEMVIQEQMNLREAELEKEPGTSAAEVEERAPREGWERAMRLIRRFGANARYFSDAAPKIALDVAAGDAAAGMCIDFYGRFQSEAVAKGGSSRIGFAMPRAGTSIDADPIGLLRGAPHRDLAIAFIEFVLSPRGQKLWDFKVGAPGGPERYALRRLPISPALYAPEYDAFRSDPEEHPYEQARSFSYRGAWTAPLLRSIAFVVKVMCVDTEDDLREAYRSLVLHSFPPRATAAFDDIALVDYEAAKGPIRAALASGNSVDEAAIANRLVGALRSQYRAVAELARNGDRR